MITHIEAAAIRVAVEGSTDARQADLVDGYSDLVPTQKGLDALQKYDERVARLFRQLDCFVDDQSTQTCINHEDVISEFRELLGAKVK